ncbi:hypothetical protein CEXT_626871 [Caerostris extrusa]|uniref:Uncharacterized protein n=1 Tax=Caerostris extrusa TaxID=172846 RepID=A0AAV4MKY5_CAEEX|nr:hypothetical protein CEXT_626871 [Caerostris extrusa]
MGGQVSIFGRHTPFEKKSTNDADSQYLERFSQLAGSLINCGPVLNWLEVGFFPCECVEIIGDKVPQSFKIPKAPAKTSFTEAWQTDSFLQIFSFIQTISAEIKTKRNFEGKGLRL